MLDCETNRHHVLFTKNEWNSTPNGKFLRGSNGLIIPMNAEVHKLLHHDIEDPGLILGASAIHFLAEREREEHKLANRNGIGSIALLMSWIDHTNDPNKDKEILHLASQLPYIIEGTKKGTFYSIPTPPAK